MFHLSPVLEIFRKKNAATCLLGRAHDQGIPEREAMQPVEIDGGEDVRQLGRDHVELGRLHGLSFWDALVVRSAKQAGCSVLLTEDFQHGREMEGLRIVNPFVS